MTATSPRQVMDLFDSQLAGPIGEAGADALRGAWVRDPRRSEVSSTLAQGIEDERSQFSLVNLPSTAGGDTLGDGGTG